MNPIISNAVSKSEETKLEESRAPIPAQNNNNNLIRSLFDDVFQNSSIKNKQEVQKCFLKLFYPKPVPQDATLTYDTLFSNIPNKIIFNEAEQRFVFDLIKKMNLTRNILLYQFLGIHLYSILNELQLPELKRNKLIADYYLAIIGLKRSFYDSPLTETVKPFYLLPRQYIDILKSHKNDLSNLDFDKAKLDKLFTLESIIINFLILEKGNYMNEPLNKIFPQHAYFLAPQSRQQLGVYKSNIIQLLNLFKELNDNIFDRILQQSPINFSRQSYILTDHIPDIKKSLDSKISELIDQIPNCDSYANVTSIVDTLRLIMLLFDSRKAIYDKKELSSLTELERDNEIRYTILIKIENQFVEMLFSIFDNCYITVIDNPSISVIGRATRIQMNLYSLAHHKNTTSSESPYFKLQRIIEDGLTNYFITPTVTKAYNEISETTSKLQGLKKIIRNPFFDPYIQIKHPLLELFQRLINDAKMEFEKSPNMNKKRRIKELTPLLKISLLINDLFVMGLNKPRPVFPDELLELLLPSDFSEAVCSQPELSSQPVEPIFEEELHMELEEETEENDSSDEEAERTASLVVSTPVSQSVITTSSPIPKLKTDVTSNLNLKIAEPLRPNTNHQNSANEKAESKEFAGPKKEVAPDDIRRTTKRREIARILRQLGFQEVGGGRHSSHFVTSTGGQVIVPSHPTIEAVGTRGSIADQAAAALLSTKSPTKLDGTGKTTSEPTQQPTKAKTSQRKKQLKQEK